MNYKYIDNNYNMERIGTRCKVMHGKALQTTGGLTKKDLKYNKNGEIVSKKVSDIAKKEKRLIKAGYITKKGHFGSIKVGGNPKEPRAPVKKGKLTNNNIKENLNFAIRKILDNNNNKQCFIDFKNNFHSFTSNTRNTRNVNPNNAIYFDTQNNKVYKIGLWDSPYRCIKNEYIAYSLLNKKYKNDNVKNYSEMFSCELIPDTEYALLVIGYKDIIPYKSNNWNNDPFVNNAKNYLVECGIKDHGDISGNLFYYMERNNKNFYWIDFEASIFNTSKINNLSINIQNRIKIKKRSLNNGPHTSRRISSRFYDFGNNGNNGNNGNTTGNTTGKINF